MEQEPRNQVVVAGEEAQPYAPFQARPLVSIERQASLEREAASHRAQLEKESKDADHRRRLDLMGFSVLVVVFVVGFVCGILPDGMVGDQKWAQSIAAAVMGLLIGRYTTQKK